MPTILVTGCSSGFGLEIARHFLSRGWTVAATMRTPRADLLPPSDRLRLLPLDVSDPDSIRGALDQAGPLDALVNNAGIGLLTALEATTMEAARDVFETNTLGTIAVTRAVLPQFRERGAGVIVNVSSTVTLTPLPLLSVYAASKAAVNAFTEALAPELEQFGIRVRLVLPGRAPDTRFGDNARAGDRVLAGLPEPYVALSERVFAGMRDTTLLTTATDVAAAVWRAVTDPSAPMRLPAGADAADLFARGSFAVP